jgi:hypothetical protein
MWVELEKWELTCEVAIILGRARGGIGGRSWPLVAAPRPFVAAPRIFVAAPRIFVALAGGTRPH